MNVTNENTPNVETTASKLVDTPKASLSSGLKKKLPLGESTPGKIQDKKTKSADPSPQEVEKLKAELADMYQKVSSLSDVINYQRIDIIEKDAEIAFLKEALVSSEEYAKHFERVAIAKNAEKARLKFTNAHLGDELTV